MARASRARGLSLAGAALAGQHASVNGSPPQPGAQSSRDALLIHGISLLAAASAVTVSVFLGPSHQDLPVVLGMGISATFVLGVWSVVLAIRALRKGERARRAVAVLLLFLVELAAASVLLAAGIFERQLPSRLVFWAVRLGLPVLLPVLLLATAIVAPIAWWRVRRAERLAVAAGGAAWPRARRWKRGLIWYLAVAAVVAALALPVPLFILCACTAHWEYRAEDRTSWRAWVRQRTPLFVGDAAAALLAGSTQPFFADGYARVLRTGRVSPERLTAELQSSVSWVPYAALEGLVVADKRRAADAADQVGRRGLVVRNTWLYRNAGMVLAQFGSPDQVRYYLNPALKPPPPFSFLSGVLIGILQPRRTAFLGDVERFCEGDSPNRDDGLRALAKLTSDPARCWPKLFADPDPSRRRQSVFAIQSGDDVNLRMQVLLVALETRNDAVLAAFAHEARDIMALCGGASRDVTARTTQAVLPLLDDQNLDVRRASAWAISGLIIAPADLESKLFQTASLMTDGNTQWPESPEERALREQLRDAARRWLEKHSNSRAPEAK